MGVQIPVRHRERVVLALIAAVVLGLGVVVARHLRQAAEDATVLYGRLASGLDLIDDLQFNIQETRRTLLYALHTSDANRQLAYAEQSRAAETNVDDRLSDRSALTSAPAAAAQIARLRQAWRSYLAFAMRSLDSSSKAVFRKASRSTNNSAPFGSTRCVTRSRS